MRPTIEYVEEIMNGTRERERSVLESSARPSPSSDISIIGNSAFCFAYADFLADYDERDNVSGAHSPDGLPDFAGESFVCIAEDSSSAARIRVSDTLGLRRDAVMSMLCALDTVVHITPYDLEGSGRKPSSKLVVLADPCLAEFGLFDMDTLKRATGNSVPLVSTFDLMLAELFEARPGSSLNVADMRFGSCAGGGVRKPLPQGRLGCRSTGVGVHGLSFRRTGQPASPYGGGLLPVRRHGSSGCRAGR